MNSILAQLQNAFTAMHFAEEGDLDAVKQIIQDNPGTDEVEECSQETLRQPVMPAF